MEQLKPTRHNYWSPRTTATEAHPTTREAAAVGSRRSSMQPQLEEGKNILIIGHGAMNSAIINRIRKLSLDKFWDAGCRNCELIRLI